MISKLVYILRASWNEMKENQVFVHDPSLRNDFKYVKMNHILELNAGVGVVAKHWKLHKQMEE